MKAINKITGEVINDLDPSDNDDLYYKLDKREWDFREEFPVIKRARINGIVFFKMDNHISSVKETVFIKLGNLGIFRNVRISTKGNLIFGTQTNPFDTIPSISWTI